MMKISCPVNLTPNPKRVQNRDTYKSILSMALGKIGSGVAALSMLATASSAEAQVAHAATIDTLDPTVVEQVAANYRDCIEIELDGLDVKKDAQAYKAGQEFCEDERAEEFAGEIAHANQMAAGRTRIAGIQANTRQVQADTEWLEQQMVMADAGTVAARAQLVAINASIRATTAEIITGAKQESGF